MASNRLWLLLLPAWLHTSTALADDPPGGDDDEAPAPMPTPSEPETTPPPTAPLPTAPDPSAGAPLDQDPAYRRLRDRVRDLEHRLVDLEKENSLRRVEWGGDYRTTLGSYWYHGADPQGNPFAPPTFVSLHNSEQWLHRFRLMLKAEPTDNLRIRGRISVFKRFGTNVSTPSPQDFSQGRVPSDTTLRLDRFWLDWFLTSKIALSFGRISYSNGSPGELRENMEKPDATWGLTMVDGEYDTVDVTMQVAKPFLIRGFYASWSFPNNDDLFSQNLFLNNGTNNLRIIGGNADLSSSDGRLFAQFGAYYVPKFRPFDIPLPNPSFYLNPQSNQPANAPPPLDGSLVFPSSKPSSLGTYGNVSLFLMMKKLAGFDAFVGGALGFLNPNGKGISYRGYAFDQMGMPILDANGLPAELPLLHLASDDVDANGKEVSHVTKFLYLGGRYTFPAGGVHAPKIGAEYNQASRYWISFAQPTDLLTNKLAVRGKAYEVYFIQPINERAFIRFDYQFIDADFTSGFPGNIAGATGFFGIPDFPGQQPHGGTSPPVDPTGMGNKQHLQALTATIHTDF